MSCCCPDGGAWLDRASIVMEPEEKRRRATGVESQGEGGYSPWRRRGGGAWRRGARRSGCCGTVPWGASNGQQVELDV
uniref:Uncharacterized protein n=1 Tax=Oryza punctata TaxID=4537 RepID=A0A0E0LRQ2_ORYPU